MSEFTIRQSATYARIPPDLREKLLDLLLEVDVMNTRFMLYPHDKGSTWRLRWRENKRLRSLSIGSDPKVIDAVKAVIESWHRGEITFLIEAYGGQDRIPRHMLSRIKGSLQWRQSEIQRWKEQFYAEPLPHDPDTPQLTDDEKQEFRKLPPELVKKLLDIQRQVNVLAVRFHVVKRPDRGSWTLRWRDVNRFSMATQRSLDLGKDDATAEIVRKLIIAWRNWESPLLDILFPEKVVPPEYWPLDWFHRIARTFPDSPLIQSAMQLPFKTAKPMPEFLRNGPSCGFAKDPFN